MKVAYKLVIGRVAAALAILSLPLFVWLGWRHLMVSLALGIIAVALVPGARRLPADRRRYARVLGALQRTVNPHSWRPGRH